MARLAVETAVKSFAAALRVAVSIATRNQYLNGLLVVVLGLKRGWKFKCL